MITPRKAFVFRTVGFLQGMILLAGVASAASVTPDNNTFTGSVNTDPVPWTRDPTGGSGTFAGASGSAAELYDGPSGTANDYDPAGNFVFVETTGSGSIGWFQDVTDDIQDVLTLVNGQSYTHTVRLFIGLREDATPTSADFDQFVSSLPNSVDLQLRVGSTFALSTEIATLSSSSMPTQAYFSGINGADGAWHNSFKTYTHTYTTGDNYYFYFLSDGTSQPRYAEARMDSALSFPSLAGLPEPSTLVLAGIALALFAALSRRIRRRAV